MYTDYFQLRQPPFSIAPDPRYLFMSRRHREALAHLLYGVEGGGGFVLLTGEIGAGKTTICRCLLEQVPDNCKVAYIFNPKLSVAELLRSVCDEFGLSVPEGQPGSVKDYVDALNTYLLAQHAQNRNSVLIIDEAQNLSADVLEQLRLLTNLETNSTKLLQIILIGQPELRAMVARPELEQLAQRMIARYHLGALSEAETSEYILHRLAVAGLSGPMPFRASAAKLIHRITRGIPRRINLLCDRCLLGAYAGNMHQIDQRVVRRAAVEIFGSANAPDKSNRQSDRSPQLARWSIGVTGVLFGIAAGALAASTFWKTPGPVIGAPAAAAPAAAAAQSASHPRIVNSPSALVDLNDAFVTMAEDEASAYRQLMQLWGMTIAAENPCLVAQASGVQCYVGNGGFSELLVLDRPAVLKLFDKDGKPHYALLTELSARAATLRVGAATYTVHPTALARHFRGSFATVWKAPLGFNDKITLGDHGPAVDWLAASLAALNSAQTNETQAGQDTDRGRVANQALDQTLMRKLKDFQIAQGLKPDGIAGPKTMMYVNRAVGVDEPRLQKTTFAASGK